MMKCSPKHYLFIILIVLHVSGYQSVKKGELMTKVPRACKKLPQLTKRCMNGKGQSSKNCKKLPTITKKCQNLSESWQLLAETLKKVTKKGGETVAPKEEDSYMTLPPDEEWSYDEGSYEYDEYYGSNGSSENDKAASESTKNENERKGTVPMDIKYILILTSLPYFGVKLSCVCLYVCL